MLFFVVQFVLKMAEQLGDVTILLSRSRRIFCLWYKLYVNVPLRSLCSLIWHSEAVVTTSSVRWSRLGDGDKTADLKTK